MEGINSVIEKMGGVIDRQQLEIEKWQSTAKELAEALGKSSEVLELMRNLAFVEKKTNMEDELIILLTNAETALENYKKLTNDNNTEIK